MRAVDLDGGFARSSVEWFERLFGLALLVEIATQMSAGVWRVHAGELYPWRHIDVVPLVGTTGLAIEWAVVGACALVLVLGNAAARAARAPRAAERARAVAWRVLAFALFASLLQRFSNHGSLFFLIAFFVSMRPPELSLDTSDFEARPHPNLGLVRAELVIVYVFSALAKLAHGFTSGASLVNLLGLTPALARTASIAVVAVELLLPIVVVRRPRLGLAAVVLVHAAFAAAIPGVVSFGLAMLAMTALWVRGERGERDAADVRAPS